MLIHKYYLRKEVERIMIEKLNSKKLMEFIEFNPSVVAKIKCKDGIFCLDDEETQG
jgi:hypothetical protein